MNVTKPPLMKKDAVRPQNERSNRVPLYSPKKKRSTRKGAVSCFIDTVGRKLGEGDQGDFVKFATKRGEKCKLREMCDDDYMVAFLFQYKLNALKRLFPIE